jgi:EAL domain-containing protein (putative c-di-GMP-specific phosphodiesterase class I)
MVHDASDAAIVRSTVELAHNLGYEIVAEGVESRETLDLLTRMGCDSAQGYFMGRPVPVDQIPAWLAESPWSPSRDQ